MWDPRSLWKRFLVGILFSHLGGNDNPAFCSRTGALCSLTLGGSSAERGERFLVGHFLPAPWGEAIFSRAICSHTLGGTLSNGAFCSAGKYTWRNPVLRANSYNDRFDRRVLALGSTSAGSIGGMGFVNRKWHRMGPTSKFLEAFQEAFWGNLIRDRTLGLCFPQAVS